MGNTDFINGDGTVKVSFIVPAYNEQLLIGRTLVALHAAGRSIGEPYEIIVADDASDDATARVALEHGARVVATNNRQIAATRNAGARAALGDLLIFVDADTMVPVDTARAAVDAFCTQGLVAGGCICTFDEPRPRWVTGSSSPR